MFASITIELWESKYMLFIIPGVVGWILSVVWWSRDRNKLLPLLLQCVFTLEVAIGGVAAYVTGITYTNEVLLFLEQHDPTALANDQQYMAKIALIYFVVHWSLLLATIAMAILTSRKIKLAEQDAASKSQGVK